MRRLMVIAVLAPLLAQPKPDPRKIEWSAARPGCETVNEFGQESKIIAEPDLAVRTYIHDQHTYYAVGVRIANGTGHDIVVEPAYVSLEIQAPEQHSLHYLDAHALARRVYQEETTKAMALAPSQQPNRGRIRDPRSAIRSPNRVILPKANSDETADEGESVHIEQAGQQADLIKTNALQSQRLTNGANLTGYVYFEHRPFAKAAVHITVDGREFIIPFKKTFEQKR